MAKIGCSWKCHEVLQFPRTKISPNRRLGSVLLTAVLDPSGKALDLFSGTSAALLSKAMSLISQLVTVLITSLHLQEELLSSQEPFSYSANKLEKEMAEEDKLGFQVPIGCKDLCKVIPFCLQMQATGLWVWKKSTGFPFFMCSAWEQFASKSRSERMQGDLVPQKSQGLLWSLWHQLTCCKIRSLMSSGLSPRIICLLYILYTHCWNSATTEWRLHPLMFQES